MNASVRWVAVVAFVFICLLSPAVFAQKVEFNLHGGGFFPATPSDIGRFRNEGIYGLRSSLFLTDRIEIGSDFSYINHFDLKTNNPTMLALDSLGMPRSAVHAATWEVNGMYNFYPHRFLLDKQRFTPYASIGLGGVTAFVRQPAGFGSENGLAFSNVSPEGVHTTVTQDQQSVILSGRPAAFGVNPDGSTFFTPSPAGTTVMHTGDTFFAISYGVGVKAERMWGPVGLTADVRGRTLPNFFGHPMTWTQVSGGLLLTLGER